MASPTEAALTGLSQSDPDTTEPRTWHRDRTQRPRPSTSRESSSRKDTSETSESHSDYSAPSDSSSQTYGETPARRISKEQQPRNPMLTELQPTPTLKKSSQKRSPSLLDQNYVMVARLAKSKILDEELLKVMAQHLQDRNAALTTAGIADATATTEDIDAAESAEIAPPCTPLCRKRDIDIEGEEEAKWHVPAVPSPPPPAITMVVSPSCSFATVAAAKYHKQILMLKPGTNTHH